MRIVGILPENRSKYYCCSSGLGRTRTGKLVGEPQVIHPSYYDGIGSGCCRDQSNRYLLSDARIGMRKQESKSASSGYYLV